jgi:hypothetical protein
MFNRIACLAIVALVMAGCAGSSGQSGAPGPSARIADATAAAAPTANPPVAAVSPAGTPGGPANAYCSLFTVDEVQVILGAPVGTGGTAAGGTGCQWAGQAGGTYLQIQAIDDPSYYVEQTGADGFEEVPGIGLAAFVVPELGGWAAQAQTGSATYAVAVNGGTSTKQTAISLLRTLIERRP